MSDLFTNDDFSDLIEISPGVRTRGPMGQTPLEELLSRTGGSMRGMAPPPEVPPIWSVDRLLIDSAPPASDVHAR